MKPNRRSSVNDIENTRNMHQEHHHRRNTSTSRITQSDYIESEEALGQFIASTGIDGGAHNITSPSSTNTTNVVQSYSNNPSYTSSSNTSPIISPTSTHTSTSMQSNANHIDIPPNSSQSNRRRSFSPPATYNSGAQIYTTNNRDNRTQNLNNIPQIIESLPVVPSAPILPLAPTGDIVNIPPVEAYLVNEDNHEHEFENDRERTVQGYTIPG